MFSTLRFLLNKPLFTVPVLLLIAALVTSHSAPKAKHINPWASASASGAASDGDSDSAAASSSSSQ